MKKEDILFARGIFIKKLLSIKKAIAEKWNNQKETSSTELLLKKQKSLSDIKMYEVLVHEKKYINQADALTTVSFRMPSHDWLLVGNSDEWNQFEKLLLEIRNKHNRM